MGELKGLHGELLKTLLLCPRIGGPGVAHMCAHTGVGVTRTY